MSRLPFSKSLTALAVAATLNAAPALAGDRHEAAFARIATFPAFLNTGIDQETVAEIVAASEDGNTLVYTDSAGENIGFVDIADPAHPQPLGTVAVGGEPTSVAVVGEHALVAVNTSPSFVAPSGKLLVVNIATRAIVADIDLGGQPDAVAVSPDRRYAAVAIENERDEDLGDGAPPQAPGGYLIIVDLVGGPLEWTTRKVDLAGLPGMLYAEDPEPEYVAVNERNVAVVTLQENNHIALVDLVTGEVIHHFSAGTVDLDRVDTVENDLIELDDTLTAVPREPDGATWLSNDVFATADEGDLHGGGRGFTLFDTSGAVRHTAGHHVEHTVVRHGHYPEDRSENKGNEPENVLAARYGEDDLLFVGSERASVVLVYKLDESARPELAQVLPAGVKPEGLLAIPQRDLLVVAGEEDAREDKIRAALTIYRLGKQANYPTVVSRHRADGTPIPWGALSGLATTRHGEETTYAVHDSFYDKSRIFVMDVKDRPAEIAREIVLRDTMGRLTAVQPTLVNADGSVHLDPEGIAVGHGGGFWIASEGRGTVGDAKRPFETPNLLLKVAENGVIERVVTLPAAVDARQVRFGFEGVASVGAGEDEVLYVAFQREWAGDPKGHVRIGRYAVATGAWTFYYYPLDAAASAYGGWVGLSELTAVGNDAFLVIERDNQAGADAAVKRIYKFSVAGLTPVADEGGAPAFPLVPKQLVHDLMPDLRTTGGQVLEKIEGLTVLRNGDVLVVNDNDGVDDSNGETQLLKLKKPLKKAYAALDKLGGIHQLVVDSVKKPLKKVFVLDQGRED